MLFTDPFFMFLLLPLGCALFYLVTPRFGPSFGLGTLLVISLLFYLPWGWYYFFLLVVSITVNFVSAYFLLATPDSFAARRRLAFVLGLAYDFGSLIWFKYRLPVLQGMGLVHPPAGTFSAVDIAIPIGISFYTFQQAVFLLDAYHREEHVVAYLGNLTAPWGKLKAYIHHAFFVAFFPHLVIGPIVYLSEFQPQVENPQFGRLRIRDLEVGLTIIVIGFFKKAVLADNLAGILDPVFGSADLRVPLSPELAWVGTLAYYAQLYFDFSGYSDMAIGTARLLGVRFPINFYSPFKAVGIIDYWRRWHITLTRVIARFLYIPLSMAGARFSAKRRWRKLPSRIAAQWFPLLLNFQVIALWHGARLTYVMFGLINGIWYVLETETRGSKKWKAWKKKVPAPIRATLGRIIFTIGMVLSFAIFRSSSMESFGYLLSQMFGAWPTLQGLADQRENLEFLALAFGIIWLLPNSVELLRHYRPGIRTYDNESYVYRFFMWAWKPNALWTAVGVAMFVLAMRYFYRQPPFLYMGF